jgi:glycosyltransferase involved in cell wall biosynthesis
MRILHLIDSGGVYGAERILLYLAREQKRLGHEPCIASIARPQCPETPLERAARSWGLEVLPIRIARTPTPAVLRYLLQQVRSTGAEVMHSHGYKADVLLGPWPRRWRAPMVTTLHGWTNSRAFTALWLYEGLDRLSLRNMELVVVVTRSMLELPALRGVASARKCVIRNGIPPLAARMNDLQLSEVAALPAEYVAFMQRRPTFIAIARLSPEKGLSLLLDAFAKACNLARTEHQLLIVGEGPERSSLAQKIAELGLQDRIMLTGYLEGADRLLQHSAAFLMSSFTEGMPLVLLEALQWNVPVIATAVGAIPELLPPQRGQLVAPRDMDALAHALGRLMSSQASAVAVGQESMEGDNESVRMAQEYLQAYRNIV